ncbi:MAG: hypothetical protein VX933_04565 [Bacteroidota bacterium]|nr:hypothetical protein [Bacteroidota bacterium]
MESQTLNFHKVREMFASHKRKQAKWSRSKNNKCNHFVSEATCICLVAVNNNVTVIGSKMTSQTFNFQKQQQVVCFLASNNKKIGSKLKITSQTLNLQKQQKVVCFKQKQTRQVAPNREL